MKNEEAIKRMKIIMDKEELSENNIAPNLLAELIDDIYNDFESRICKNCKHKKRLICKKLQNLFKNNFGCNRFERE